MSEYVKVENKDYYEKWYTSESEEVDWPRLRHFLKDHLALLIETIHEDYERATTKKVYKDDTDSIDYTVFMGSGGVCLALMKYS